MTEKKTNSENEEKEVKKEDKFSKLEAENAKLKAEVEEWKNKYYMAFADTQNLQKNLEKEHQSFIKYRSMGFVEKLLPALDCFHTALGVEQTDPVLKNYLVGFNYVYKMLTDALDSEGVSEIAPKQGDKFDYNTMEAVDTIEAEDENLVYELKRKGYLLHDRIIKHAQVVVTKKPEPVAENKKEEATSTDTPKAEENSTEEKSSEKKDA